MAGVPARRFFMLIQVIEGGGAAIERGIIEHPLRRSELPNQLGKIMPIFIVTHPSTGSKSAPGLGITATFILATSDFGATLSVTIGPPRSAVSFWKTVTALGD